MNCEELILSVVVVLLLMLLISFVFKCKNNRYHYHENPEDRQYFSNKTSQKPLPKIMWGGVPINVNSVMDHGDTGMDDGLLPVSNSKTAIRRLQAETVTPPWMSDSIEPDTITGDFAEHFLNKRSAERNGFKKQGSYKGATGVRYMKIEKRE